MTPRAWYFGKLAAFSAFPIIPLLAPIGHYAALPWLSPLFVFFAIPGFDLLIGSDRTRPLERPAQRAATLWLYFVPHVYVVAWLATLIWAAMVLPDLSSFAERTSILIGVALASAFATCAGHELVHWPGTLDRFMSRLTMATVAYGQFVTEHLHHHATVGIVRAGTTPTFGQSVWSFVLRNVAFSFRNSWRIERRRQLRVGKSLLGNLYVQQWLATAMILGLFIVLGGTWGAILFFAQASPSLLSSTSTMPSTTA